MDGEEETVTVNIDDAFIIKSDTDELCRLCANTDNQLIPIFKGEGLEHNIPNIIEQHLPIVKVTELDKLPLQICYQCASTLIAWHNLYEGCQIADMKLREIFLISDKLYPEDEALTEYVEDYVNDFNDHSQDDYQTLPFNDTVNTSDNPADEILINSHLENTQLTVTQAFDETEEDIPNERLMTVEVQNYDGGLDDVIVSFKTDDLLRPTQLDVDVPRADDFLVDVAELKSGKISAEITSVEISSTECMSRADTTLLNGFVLNDHTSRYHCARCFKAHATKDLLLSHIRSEHTLDICGSELYECDVCAKLFAKNIHRNRHRLNVHNAETPLAKRFMVVRNDGSNVSRIELTGDESSYHCKQCDKHFALMGKLKMHKMRKHGVVYENARRCSICSAVMLNKRALNLHLRLVHSSTPAAPPTLPATPKVALSEEYLEFLSKRVVFANQTRYFQCETCPYRCHGMQQFVRHQRRHVGSNPTCGHCGKTFAAKGLLKRHIVVVHMRIKKFDCKVCGKRFGERRHMQEHMNLHSTVCSYMCEICGKQFKQRQSLAVHKQIHRGKKSFPCEHCAKAFTFRAKLLNHMKRHTGQNLSVCKECGKKFTSSSHLRVHMLAHSNARPFTCHVCNKSLKTSRTLKQHMIVFHNREQNEASENGAHAR